MSDTDPIPDAAEPSGDSARQPATSRPVHSPVASPVASLVAQAMEALVVELAEAGRAEARATRHLEAARGRRTHLLAAMQRLMRLEPAETRAHWNGRIQAAVNRPERHHPGRAPDARLAEVYTFLTVSDARTPCCW